MEDIMALELKINRTDHPLGATEVTGCFSRQDGYIDLRVPAKAEIHVNDFAIILIQHGAAFHTVSMRFASKPVVTRPLRQAGIAGIVVIDREQKTKSFRASPRETLTLVAGPELVIEADAGNCIRELHRVPLASVQAVQIEAPVHEEPGRVQFDPGASRILLPAG
jgi:hypothetical protein